MGATVYRLFDGASRLLYVGVASRWLARMEDHRKRPWFRDVATITVEHFDKRSEAEQAEKAAIQTEAPQYNIVGTCWHECPSCGEWHRPAQWCPSIRWPGGRQFGAHPVLDYSRAALG